MSIVCCSSCGWHLSPIPIALQEQDVQQPPETALEPTSDGGQDGEDAHDLVQSGRSRGKSRYLGHTTARVDRY